MTRSNIAITLFLLLLIGIFQHFYCNNKFAKITFIDNNNISHTHSYFVPDYATFHIYKGRLQYTKQNGWHETIQYNVKQIKEIR